MRSKFPSYFPLSQVERAQVWSDAIISMDANVLLNVYRVNAATAENLFNIYEHVSDQLWVSHQAVLEYLQNRVRVIEDSLQAYDGATKNLQELKGNLEKLTSQLPRHPLIDANAMSKKLRSSIEVAVSDIQSKKEDHPDFLTVDEFLESYEAQFEEKVGDPFSKDELKEIHEEAERRYAQDEGPGHKDKKKPGIKKYGDYVIWKQLIAKCRSEQKPLVFVIDDQKSDWWHIVSGKRTGPSHELIEEFFEETGQSIHMYSMDKFMEHARTILNIEVADEAIEDALEVSASTSISEALKDLFVQEKIKIETSPFKFGQFRSNDDAKSTAGLESVWKPNINDSEEDKLFKMNVIEEAEKLGISEEEIANLYAGVRQTSGLLGISSLSESDKKTVSLRLDIASLKDYYDNDKYYVDKD